MRQTRALIILLLIISTILVSCKNDDNDSNSSNLLNSTTDSKGIAETETKEVDYMKREFCTVESLQKDSFTLKNTADELYHIGNSFLGDFEVGDNVLLLYLDRTSMGNREYSADVYAIYPDDDSLLQPAN